MGLPPQCTLQYAALLDLAELARHYGSSSAVFAGALDSVAGQLDECLGRTAEGDGAASLAGSKI